MVTFVTVLDSDVTRLWRHSVRLMNEWQSVHDSQYKLFVGAFSNNGS